MFVPGVINTEALRRYRENAQQTNCIKDLRFELAHIVGERLIYPKNRYQKKTPFRYAQYEREVIERHIALMQKRGIWNKPVIPREECEASVCRDVRDTGRLA